MINIGIIGCRSRDTLDDFNLVLSKVISIATLGNMDSRKDFYTIISGGCPKGGDRFARGISKILNIPIIEHLPEWDKFGKSAGFIRNTYIARDSNILIACVREDRIGGTEDTIRKYLKLGKDKLYLV
jgi:transposase